MFKVFGAILVIGGCGYAGLKMGWIYRLRTDTLRLMQNGLNLLETEISYGATPLPLALRRAGEKLGGETSIVFLHSSSLLQQNVGFTASEAWSAGVQRLKQEVPLTKEETSILLLFGNGLGSSARNEQLKNIALAKEQLNLAREQAAEERARHEKMWQYLGFCLGAVIVLVFI